MERNLIEYLPEYLHEYNELKQIMNTEQVEFSLAWKAIKDVFLDQFISTATKNGVERWERILKIRPKNTDTLDERRFRILTRLNEQLLYTYTTLKQRLGALCGEDGYYVLLNNNAYSLLVKLALSNESNIDDVTSLLERMLPVNMQYKVMLFNAHGILSEFTHAQLNQYTQEQLRKEVL